MQGGEVPEFRWTLEDDECDCVFQRIGEWTNPYLGRTHRVRLCCIWAELYKEFPQYVQDIPAFYNHNTGEYEPEPWEWNGEADMPRAFWYRQLASLMGSSLEEVREKYKDQQPPKGTPRPKLVQQEVRVNLHEVVGLLTERAMIAEEELNKAIAVIAALKRDELQLDRIVLAEGGFSVLPAEEEVSDAKPDGSDNDRYK